MDTGERNYVVMEGNEDAAETIVFAHGFGCDQQVWNRVCPVFEGDYQVILYDYTGSGRSAKSAYSSKNTGHCMAMHRT